MFQPGAAAPPGGAAYPSAPMELACLDGALGSAAEARIPATDEGLLRGDGIFEVIRLYDGVPFALEHHLRRLGHSGANLRLSFDLDAVRIEVDRILEAAGAREGLLRIVVTRGGRRLLLTEPLPQLPDVMRLRTVTYAPTLVLDGVKSLSYAANMLSSRLAREQGADEALLVTPDGHVLEAPTASFFWVRDGVVRTPPLGEHILASITRMLVIELIGGVEEPCGREELAHADEAFLASTVREVMPVAAIDEAEVPLAGPVTERATRLVRERIEATLAAA